MSSGTLGPSQTRSCPCMRYPWQIGLYLVGCYTELTNGMASFILHHGCFMVAVVKVITAVFVAETTRCALAFRSSSQRQGALPKQITGVAFGAAAFRSVLEAYSWSGQIAQAEAIPSTMINPPINACAKAGNLRAAEAWFNKMVDSTVLQANVIN